MIATGLSWRMAIGALVLGNAIMGMVITINGRIGARVSLSTNVLMGIMAYIS
jgi:NCS1 family nucleobase:cation symporter-1